MAESPPPAVLTGKNVLVVHANEPNTPLARETDQALSQALQSGGIPILNQFFESLDLRRNPDPAYRRRLLEYLREKYRHRTFDLIVTMFPEALDLVLNEGRTLFPGVPVLALYLPVGTEPPKTDRRIAWHTFEFDMLGTLESALKLVPEARSVYIVGGNHEVDRQQEARARREFQPWENRLDFHYLSRMPVEEMLRQVASAPRDSIVLLLPYSTDIRGTYYTAPELAQRVNAVSPAPVFGLLNVQLGHGIVGGMLINYERIGTKAGLLALDLLRGGSALGSLASVLPVPPVPMFDWRQLTRWNLRMDALPRGSVVINREYSLWEQYHWHVLVALTLLVAQTLTILTLLVHRKYRREAELTLQDKEERLRLAVNAAGLGAWSWEIPTGRIHVSERVGGELSALPPREMSYDDALAIVHPEDRKRVDAAVQAAILTRKEYEVHYRIPRRDGTVLWIASRGCCTYNKDGRPLRMSGVSQDITERKRSELALQESEQRFRRMADAAHIMVWMSGPDKGFTYFNRSWLTFTGRRMEQEVGDRWTEGVHPEDRARIVQEYSRAFDAHEPFELEYRLRHCDGEYRWVFDAGAPLYEEDGRFCGYLGSCLDISARKRADAEADRLRRELAHISRVTLMGELATSLAHELNQPLTAIATNAHAGKRYLASAKPPLGEVAEILGDVAADAERAGEVIHRLRSLLRKDTTRFIPLDLNVLIREVVALTKTDALIRHQPIALALASELPHVRGDRIQLQQVLLNLVLNGMEAMEPLPPAKRELRIRTLREDSTVRVGVEDRGPGIPPDKLETVFDTFFTTKAHGMGMGLAISRSIIEAHGGRIWAENNPDDGATFWFSFPAGSTGPTAGGS